MKKFLLTAAAGVAALAAATTANAASTLQITSISSAYAGVSGDVKVVTPGWWGIPTTKSYTGSFAPQNVSGLWDGELVNFLAYCIELEQYSGTGNFEVVSLQDYLNNDARYNNIASAVSTYADAAAAPNSKTAAVALQLAIWELKYETKSTLDLTKGNLYTNKNSYTTAANNLLKDLGTINGNLEFWVAKNDKKQDLLFYTIKPAVPEPATWAMMIIGFAAVGRAMRTRRNTAMRVSFS